MKDNFFLVAESAAVLASGMKGKPLRANVVARIKDQDAEPVTGLTQSNFQVINMDTVKEIESQNMVVSELVKDSLLLPGTYNISFTVPLNKIGQYVFAIKVKKVTKPSANSVSQILLGQTLVSVIKLE